MFDWFLCFRFWKIQFGNITCPVLTKRLALLGNSLPCILSTVEAISATLYITRFKDEARELLDGFKWGHTFLELNHDLLEAYSEVDSSAEVVKVQNEILSEKGINSES